METGNKCGVLSPKVNCSYPMLRLQVRDQNPKISECKQNNGSECTAFGAHFEHPKENFLMMEISNDDIPALRGWFNKEKRDKYRRRNSIIPQAQSNRRWFAIERIPINGVNAESKSTGNATTHELALCYYRKSSVPNNERSGWIFLSDVISISQDVADRWITIEHPTRTLRIQSPAAAQHRVWFSTLSKCCRNAWKESTHSDTPPAEENKPPNIPLFNAPLLSSPSEKKISNESTPKDELDFLREINGRTEETNKVDLPSRKTMFLSNSPSSFETENETDLKPDQGSKAALDDANHDGFRVKMIAVEGETAIYPHDNDKRIVDSFDENLESKNSENEHISSTQSIVGGNCGAEAKEEAESIKDCGFEDVVKGYLNDSNNDVISNHKCGNRGSDSNSSTAVKQLKLQEFPTKQESVTSCSPMPSPSAKEGRTKGKLNELDSLQLASSSSSTSGDESDSNLLQEILAPFKEKGSKHEEIKAASIRRTSSHLVSNENCRSANSILARYGSFRSNASLMDAESRSSSKDGSKPYAFYSYQTSDEVDDEFQPDEDFVNADWDEQ
mmetsp:Transcript_20975/g.43876  ORF Transcript_20975/g.43876 Transcript_20975/m.43876 type:complete len:559 (+) Transcript_20975:79-1755(+)